MSAAWVHRDDGDEAPPPAPGAAPARLMERWSRLVAAHEVAESRVLQWFYASLLFSFLITFNDWSGDTSFTAESVRDGSYRCWPYFQECAPWHVLSGPPHGISHLFVYAVLLVVMVAAAWAALRSRWDLAMALMVPLFVWKFLQHFLLSMAFVGNYHYFHLAFSCVFLFCHNKLYFLRRTLVALYFLASTIKIDPGWILGTYFTSLRTGMPLFPDVIAPLATQGVVLLEMVGAPLLLSPRPRLQRTALAALVLFHLYSGILVKYRYPAMCLPPLLILFGPWLRRVPPPASMTSLPGWALIALMFVAQGMPLMIRGDTKLTLEGNYYGLYMFEANHQCVSTVIIHRADGTSDEREKQSAAARHRCSPYSIWFRLKHQCKKAERIEWRFDHSINGGPFYRIVDVDNACTLQYAPFEHNEWIQLPEDGARIMGYPVKNYYD